MRARRGVQVGREKSWANIEISPAVTQSTADRRRCGDGELQRSEADVDNFNYEPAILTYSRIKNGCAIRSIYRLHCYSGRVHQYKLYRNVQTRLSDKSKSPVRLPASSNWCLSVRPKPCAGLVRCPSSFRRRLRSRADLFDCDAAAGNRGHGQARGAEGQGETPGAVG